MAAQNTRSRKALEFLKANKIGTLDDLKDAVKSNSTMTVFRSLKALDYLSSYSHRGMYYTLPQITDFDELGLWSYQSVWFSKYGNLIETAREFIENSKAGYTYHELEDILHVETKHALLNLFKKGRITRERMGGYYVYLGLDPHEKRRQISMRKAGGKQFEVDLSYEIKLLSEELKAAIILFFSMLDEKQRRLYAGLESYKLGHGGDRQIAKMLGLDAHTVSKGRRELFGQDIPIDRIRKKGAGRKAVEKKFRKSRRKLDGS